MNRHALLRTYPNGLRACITPRDHSYQLELYDEHGHRKPDLPVIASSLEDAQQMADDHAGVTCRDPWMPVYRGTFNVALPDDSSREQRVKSELGRREFEV